MSQTIWVLRDTYEPIEGPYWSGHIRELIKAAKNEKYNLIEACIDECINPHPTDLLLFRPTQDGTSRRSFIKKVRSVQAFSINKNSSFYGSKQAFLKLAKEIDIPIPKTWIGSQFHQHKTTTPNGFVVKPSKGSQGSGIVLCKTRRQAIREVRRQNAPTVVQEFIPLTAIEDIRLIMVGETLCGAMRRVLNPNNSGEFRANLSLGTSHPVAYTPTQEMVQYAQKIMRHTQLDFAGIDILIHNQSPLFLECNTRPGLKGIVQIDDQIPVRVLKGLYKRAQRS